MKQLLVLSVFLTALCACGVCQANGSSSPCATFPCVVASISLVNQTEPLNQMPVYTPTASGLFRVSYFEQDGELGFGLWSFTWNWTDDARYETFGSFQLPPTSYFNVGIPSLRVLAGHPITVTVSGRGGSYNLFATVEQLQ
jgi:hypothetical protein